MGYGKSINLFLEDGTDQSTITSEIFGWNGMGFKLNRDDVSKFKLAESQDYGIYFLIVKEDDDSESVYIGESENVINRLKQHIQDYNAGKKDYYWTEAVFFVGKGLNKTYIKWLENYFCNLAKVAKRCNVLTKSTSQLTIGRKDEAILMEFADNVKLLLNALGYKFLKPLSYISKIDDGKNEENLLYFNGPKYQAVGKIVDDGFLILKGSQINDVVANTLLGKLKVKRQTLIDSGVIVNGQFVEDVLLSSPSSAASFIAGCQRSGPISWIDKDGVSLKDK